MNLTKTAHLTSSLLARKGAAIPSTIRAAAAAQNRVGSDRIAEVFRLAHAEARSSGSSGRTAPAAGSESKSRAIVRDNTASLAGGGSNRIKLSLRLDRERHARLRIAAAYTGRHLQGLLVEALDKFLQELPASPASDGYAADLAPSLTDDE